MEEKIWQLFLAIFTAVATVTVEKIAEKLKSPTPTKSKDLKPKVISVAAGIPFGFKISIKEHKMENVLLILVTVAVTHILYKTIRKKENR